MKRIVMWFLSTLTVVVLLFGYHTSTSGPAGGTHTVIASPAPDASASPSTSPSASPSTGSGTSSTAKTTTVTGPSVDTQWGPVQVALKVSDGKITAVTVPVYPSGNPKDQEINAYALPILIAATVKAQSASIDMVSGATVTSQGYLSSLQGAIDQAKL